MSPQAKRNLTLVAVVLGVTAILGLLIWAVSAAVGRYNIRERTQSADQHIQQAQAALKIQDYAGAEREYEAARSALPDSPEEATATKGLAVVCVARGLDAYTHNDLGGALTYYNRALGHDRTNASAWLYLGNLKSDQGDPITALKDWQNTIENDHGNFAAEAKKNSAIAELSLGERAMQTNQMALARQYWQKAVDIDPGSDAAQRANQNLASAAPSQDNTAVVSNQ